MNDDCVLSFQLRNCDEEARLSADCTLQECGFEGGPERKPQHLTLYYNYDVEYSDCPLLNCDHYFGHEKHPLNPVLTAYPKKTKGITDDQLHNISKLISKI